MVALASIEAVFKAILDTAYCIRKAIERDVLKGCDVKVATVDGVVLGKAVGIGYDGSLLIRVNDRVEHLYCCHVLEYRCNVHS